jgi:hypothetical protein
MAIKAKIENFLKGFTILFAKPCHLLFTKVPRIKGMAGKKKKNF